MVQFPNKNLQDPEIFSMCVLVCILVQKNIRVLKHYYCCRFSPTLNCYYQSNMIGKCFTWFHPIMFLAKMSAYSSAVWKNIFQIEKTKKGVKSGNYSDSSGPK